jgi:hypothetical protein
METFGCAPPIGAANVCADGVLFDAGDNDDFRLGRSIDSVRSLVPAGASVTEPGTPLQPYETYKGAEVFADPPDGRRLDSPANRQNESCNNGPARRAPAALPPERNGWTATALGRAQFWQRRGQARFD